ncbi:MAG: hypothetical protein RL748_3371 [Pseudomonadota bacterium]|jgi:hypothetical protein
MPSNRINSLTRIALMIAALGLPFGMAHAADEKKVEETARTEVGKPLNVVGDLIKEKKYAEAMAKVAIAENVKDRTPYENYIIERTRAAIASAAGDVDSLIKSTEVLLNSGRLDKNEQPLFMKNLIASYYNKKNFAKVVEWIERLFKDGHKDDQMHGLLIQAYYLNNDYANAMRLLQADIAALEKDGKKPEEDQINLMRNCAAKLKDKQVYDLALEKLVVHYPSAEHWDEFLSRFEASRVTHERLLLDVYRLRLLTVKTLAEADAKEMVELDLLATLPAEAKKTIDLAFEKGVFGVGANAAEHKKLRDKVNKSTADDLKNIGQGEITAGKSKEGNGLVNVGMGYVSHGQYEKGIALIEQGIKVGKLKQPEDAKLRLAEAQIFAGKKAEALETLKTVQGGDGLPQLARLWSIYASQK